MNKRALMLSAAAVALLSAPAMAVGPTTITAVQTTAQKTSATGDLTINSTGGISFKSATIPMLTIDSSNAVNNGGTFSGAGQTTATAVEIDATGSTGSFLTNGTIDLSGAGTGKTAIYLKGLGSFTGTITLDANSVISVQGDQSAGILSDTGAILNGDLLLGGTFSMSPTTANETSASGVTIANLLGTTNGNIAIGTGATYTATGAGAQGIVISGPIKACNTVAVPGCVEIGTFANSGSLGVAGVATRSTTSANAESGSALIIGNSVAGGILNNGPSVAGGSTAVAAIAGNGAGTAPTIDISPIGGVPITIGVDSADPVNPTFSFINRGSISAAPEDPNQSAHAIGISGTLVSPTVFTGGFFTSGLISAQATSVNPGTPVVASAMEIDSFVTIPQIYVSAQSVGGTGSTNGAIGASIAGPIGGTAEAIFIQGTTGTSVQSIVIEKGARVAANASVTDPTLASVTALSAIAIEDDSGTLTSITNGGTISATATTLTNGSTSRATALFVGANTTGVTFTNTGTVVGDVLFGAGSDTYSITGSALTGIATHTGSIDFGATLSGTHDQLSVGQLANVAGTITSEGTLDVNIAGQGVLTVQNVGTTLATRNFSVATGDPVNKTSGTINITVSQGVGVPVISSSGTVTFGAGAILGVQYGSFITAGGSFTLIQAPTGGLIIGAADIARYNAAVGSASTLPFLFNSATIQKVNDDGAGHSLLQLTVSPKTVTQLGLTGYARAMFSVANAAVVHDDALGAALVAGINSSADAQKAYDAFAPDVSGGVRSIGISLTDQASGVVAARQRALRLFGKQPGDLTLWGNEFGEYISTKGGTVAADPSLGTNPTAYINSGPAPGFKDHGFGFSMGLDEGAANTGWYGAAFTFYTGDVSEGGDRISKTSTLWYMLTGYSDWRGRGLFFDSQVSVGYGNFKGKRFLELTLPATNSTFTREADSKRAGLLGSIGMTLGAMLKYGATTVIPQISLDGMTLREEGFTEINGGSGMNLTVAPYYANSLRVFLGSEIREDLNLGDFYLQPSARLGYRFDFLNDPVKLHAMFADINPTLNGNQPGAAFTIQGPDPSRGNYVAGASLAATTENWTIGLNYDFVRGSNNATEQVGTISLLGRI